MNDLTTGSLFSGYGGIELGLEWTGRFKTKWVAEINEFGEAILADRFPTVPNLGDITKVDWSTVERVDVLTGGFPCQDISNAGKRAGITGERSGLWKEYLRAIGTLRPKYVLAENVAALTQRGLDVVVADLTAIGYRVEWDCVSASAVGAPHRRDRVFVIGVRGDVPYPEQQRSCDEADERELEGAGSGELHAREPGDTGDVADPASDGQRAQRGLQHGPAERTTRSSESSVADADGRDVEAHGEPRDGSALHQPGQDEPAPGSQDQRDVPHAEHEGLARARSEPQPEGTQHRSLNADSQEATSGELPDAHSIGRDTGRSDRGGGRVLHHAHREDPEGQQARDRGECGTIQDDHATTEVADAHDRGRDGVPSQERGERWLEPSQSHAHEGSERREQARDPADADSDGLEAVAHDGLLREQADRAGHAGHFQSSSTTELLRWFRDTVGDEQWAVEPELDRMAHGSSYGMDPTVYQDLVGVLGEAEANKLASHVWKERIKAIGNGVVPQCAMLLGLLISNHHDRTRGER